MMKFRSLVLVLAIATSTLAACKADILVAVAPAEVKESAQSAARYAEAVPEARAISDLTVYKIEQDVDVNVWIIYYFSPSKNKSYRCRVKQGEQGKLEEVTDPAKQAKPDHRIDKDKWKVDSQQAKQVTVTNVTNITNVTVNVTQVTNVTLISAGEFKQATGKDTMNPVWVCVVNNVKVYVDANTGTVIHNDGTPTPMPTATPAPSPAPTATPAPTPTATPTLAPAAIQFSAGLTGAAAVPAVTTTAAGTATGTLSADKTSLALTVSWTGLSGPATAAHVHQGAAGVSGAVVKTLVLAGDGATVTWTAADPTEPLTPTLVEALLAGGLYVNVHTAANPNGEIRGQLGSP